jgi:hypothetical protein
MAGCLTRSGGGGGSGAGAPPGAADTLGHKSVVTKQRCVQGRSRDGRYHALLARARCPAAAAPAARPGARRSVQRCRTLQFSSSLRRMCSGAPVARPDAHPLQRRHSAAALSQCAPQGGAPAGEQVQRVSGLPAGGHRRKEGAAPRLRRGRPCVAERARPDATATDHGHGRGSWRRHWPTYLLCGAAHRHHAPPRRPSNPSATAWINKLQDEADMLTRKVRAWLGL